MDTQRKKTIPEIDEEPVVVDVSRGLLSKSRVSKSSRSLAALRGYHERKIFNRISFFWTSLCQRGTALKLVKVFPL
jgi:hypothetical protein